MTTEPPADLKSLIEISRELDIPYSTLQFWRSKGRLKTWRRGGREVLASLEQARKLRYEITPDEPAKQ